MLKATTKRDHSSRNGFFREQRISPDPKVQMVLGEIITSAPRESAVPKGWAHKEEELIGNQMKRRIIESRSQGKF